MRFGAMEIGLIVVLALIIFGGTRLAGIGKALGSSIRDFKREMGKSDTPKSVEESTVDTVSPADSGNTKG